MDKIIINPGKSLAVAIILSVFLGPIGVLYATLPGAFLLLVLILVAWGAHAWQAILLIWLVGCFVSTFMTNRYNKKLMNGCARCQSPD